MSRSDRLREKIQRTSEDLTTMEINTIVKHTMTGMKTSDKDSIALYELAGLYLGELERLGRHYSNKATTEEMDALHHPKQLKQQGDDTTKLSWNPTMLKALPGFKSPGEGYEIALSLEESDKRNFFRRYQFFSTGGVFSFREIAIWSNAAAKWLSQQKSNLDEDDGAIEGDRNQLMRVSSKCLEIAKMLELFFETPGNQQDLKAEKVMRIGKKPILEHLKKDIKPGDDIEWQLLPELEEITQIEATGTVWGDAVEKIAGLVQQYYSVLSFKCKNSGLYLYPINECDHQAFIDSMQAYGEGDKRDNGNEFRLDLRDRMLLRKSIDIGVEHIVMQTRIGIDGDITTRVSQSFADSPVPFVLNMHNTSIEISVNFWQKIFDTLVSFVRLLFKK